MKSIIKKQIKNKSCQVKAFTIIESLIVLSIVFTIIFLFHNSVSLSKKNINEAIFFLYFETLYKDTQMRSVLEQKEDFIQVKDGKISNSRESLIIPKTITIQNMKPIHFDNKGGNSSLKKLLFLTKEKEVKYQLYLGSGKYKKSEIKRIHTP